MHAAAIKDGSQSRNLPEILLRPQVRHTMLTMAIQEQLVHLIVMQDFYILHFSSTYIERRHFARD